MAGKNKVGELAERRSLWKRMLDWVFGYDFFVSYRWKDGREYAIQLARELESLGFDVFLDSDDYASGDNWKQIGSWTLKRTGQMVLVGTHGALESREEETPVEREVRLFSETKRRIIPISFAPMNVDGELEFLNSTLEKARRELSSRVVAFIPNELLTLTENIERLPLGPSDETLKTLNHTFKLVRQSAKRARVFAVASAALFGLLLLSCTLGVLAETSRRKVAYQLASRLYEQSHRQLEDDPLQGYWTSVRAAQVALQSDSKLPAYLDRIAHLSQRIPQFVVNLDINEKVVNADFSPNLDRVVLVTDVGNAYGFLLPSGRSFFIPTQVNENGIARGGAPHFEQDGVTIRSKVNWAHPEPDPDEQGSYVLSVDWNTEAEEILSPVDDGQIDVRGLQFSVVYADDEIPEFDSASFFRINPVLVSHPIRVVEGRRNGDCAVGITEQGTVLYWGMATPMPFISDTQLAEEVWQDGRFAGDLFVALSEKSITAWHFAPATAMIWSRPVVDAGDKCRLTPDGLAVLVGHSLYRISDGSTLAQMPIPQEITDDETQVNDGLLPGGDRLLLTAFFRGTNSRGSADELVFRKLSDNGEISDISADWDQRELQGMPLAREEQAIFANARFLATGRGGRFRVFDLINAEVIAEFHFGSKGKIVPEIAKELLKDTFAIVPSRDGKGYDFSLRSGTSLYVPASEIVEELRLSNSRNALIGPREDEVTYSQVIVLSLSGRWLAIGKGNSLRIWDTDTGFPLTEWTNTSGRILDLRFAPDENSIMIANVDGAISKFTIRFPWSRKPRWLEGLGEAMSGLTISATGEVRRFSPTELRQIRANVTSSLTNADLRHPVVGELSDRLSRSKE